MVLSFGPELLHHCALMGVGLGGEGGLSLQGLHLRRALYTKRNSCGFEQASIQNACVQGPEFRPIHLYSTVS